MPATRSPTRYTTSPYCIAANMDEMLLKAQLSPLSTSDDDSSPETPISPLESLSNSSSIVTPTPPKKRRSPNAFILYRSYIIAKKLYPPALTHQNEISRYVADKWRVASAAERAKFFNMAREEKQRFENEVADIKPGKKKRSRPNKSRTLRTNTPRHELDSPRSCDSDAKFPTLTLPFDFLGIRPPFHPQDIAAPAFDTYSLTSGNGVDPTQAHIPISTALYAFPDWNLELGVNQSDTLKSSASHLPPVRSSSYQPSVSFAPYQADGGSFDARDAAIQNEMDFRYFLEGSISYSEGFYSEFALYSAESSPSGVCPPEVPAAHLSQ